jgi:hypothetical protein
MFSFSSYALFVSQFIRAEEDIEDGGKSIDYGSPRDNSQLFAQLLVRGTKRVCGRRCRSPTFSLPSIL